MTEQASMLRGFLVVAVEEGAQLGTVSAIQVDPSRRGIVGFVYRTRWLGSEEQFVPIENVRTVGRDVLLVDREASVVAPARESPIPGRSVMDLQGVRVTADDGAHLGTLVDLEFSEGDWRISALTLADEKRLSIEPDAVNLGDDVIVPAAAKANVESTAEEKPGFLSRIFGKESVDETKAALRRALGRHKAASEEQTAVQDGEI